MVILIMFVYKSTYTAPVTYVMFLLSAVFGEESFSVKFVSQLLAFKKRNFPKHQNL